MDYLGDESNVRAVRALVEEGAYGKAVQRLVSPRLKVANDRDVLAYLRRLHPPGGPLDWPSVCSPLPGPEAPDAEVTQARLKTLREAVRTFAPGSGAGPSGLRQLHLQEMLSDGDSAQVAQLLGALDPFSGLVRRVGWIRRWPVRYALPASSHCGSRMGLPAPLQ